jgi:molybdate transport repressor ModE-like protein
MGRGLSKGIKLDPSYTVSLSLGNQSVIGELEAQMLRSIYQTGSYSEAARTLSLSYAFLWNKIAQIERSLGKKVVYSERGGAKGGRAELTNQGKQLLQDYSELDSRVHRFITQPRSSQTYGSPAELVRPNLSFMGSHCIVVEKLFRSLHSTNPKITYQILNVGSWAGLTAMMLRQADIAGLHIFDESASTYNQPVLAKFGLSRSHALIRGYKRQQCLMVRKGNPKKIRGVDDLLRKDVKLANRNLGSGTRILLDSRLHDLARTMGIDFEALTRRIRGYDSEMMTHRQVASAVSSRRADVGIGLTSVAAEMRLDFTPFAEELYDFLVEKRMRNPYAHEFFNILKSEEFQNKIQVIPGIKFSRQTGRLVS